MHFEFVRIYLKSPVESVSIIIMLLTICSSLMSIDLSPLCSSWWLSFVRARGGTQTLAHTIRSLSNKPLLLYAEFGHADFCSSSRCIDILLEGLCQFFSNHADMLDCPMSLRCSSHRFTDFCFTRLFVSPDFCLVWLFVSIKFVSQQPAVKSVMQNHKIKWTHRHMGIPLYIDIERYISVFITICTKSKYSRQL